MANKYSVQNIGNGGHPVVVIDDFHPVFPHLYQNAVSANYEKLGPYYPGLQAQADPRHLQAVSSILTDVFKTVFGIKRGVQLVQCSYSIVTISDTDLLPIQRLPHVDTTDPGRIALLHYLSGKDRGGTAFYRHKATDTEILNHHDFDEYSRAVEAEGAPKSGYMSGSDERFEMIGHIEAKPNRAVLYPSQLLHSGMIPADISTAPNSERSRLTLNSFFQANRV